MFNILKKWKKKYGFEETLPVGACKQLVEWIVRKCTDYKDKDSKEGLEKLWLEQEESRAIVRITTIKKEKQVFSMYKVKDSKLC